MRMKLWTWLKGLGERVKPNEETYPVRARHGRVILALSPAQR